MSITHFLPQSATAFSPLTIIFLSSNAAITSATQIIATKATGVIPITSVIDPSTTTGSSPNTGKVPQTIAIVTKTAPTTQETTSGNVNVKNEASSRATATESTAIVHSISDRAKATATST